jgi:hypothetical protein
LNRVIPYMQIIGHQQQKPENHICSFEADRLEISLFWTLYLMLR